MEHFVVYHNVKAMGCDIEAEGLFGINSGKPLAFVEKTIGNTIWLISGKRDETGKMVYRLCHRFQATDLKPASNRYPRHIVSGKAGNDFVPQVVLNDFPWFETLYNDTRNFSAGLSRIKSMTVVAGLLAVQSEPTAPMAEEVEAPELFFAGATKTVSVNIYERDPRARRQCLTRFGFVCCVCGFDFEKRFGEIGREFIHVHHLKPLSEIKNGYLINPLKELCPVCPNCHAMLHRRIPPFTPSQLRRRLLKAT